MSWRMATISDPKAMDPRDNVDALRKADRVGWGGMP